LKLTLKLAATKCAMNRKLMALVEMTPHNRFLY